MEDVADDRFGLIVLALYNNQRLCILWDNSGIEKALQFGSPALYMKTDFVSTYTLKRVEEWLRRILLR